MNTDAITMFNSHSEMLLVIALLAGIAIPVLMAFIIWKCRHLPGEILDLLKK